MIAPTEQVGCSVTTCDNDPLPLPPSRAEELRQKKREYDIIYRAKHKERIAAFQAKYRLENLAAFRAKRADRYKLNRDKIKSATAKRHREKKTDPNYQATRRAWVKKNPEKISAYYQKWHNKDVNASRAASRNRYHKNIERSRQLEREKTARRLSTPHGRINHRMSVSIGRDLKGGKAGRAWKSFIPYTVEELRASLEKQFKDGMTWEAFMRGEIHIDHIIPKSKFKYSSPEDSEFKKCWALDNLQPLWALDNISKGNKIISPAQIALGV